MALNLASPGIVVREVDLTIGRVDATSGSIGALVAPFAKGPVGTPVLVTDEASLLNNFGQPYETDKHYEDWLVASSYLAYGGNMRVVRADDTDLKNAFTGTAGSVKIKSTEHYNQLGLQLLMEKQIKLYRVWMLIVQLLVLLQLEWVLPNKFLLEQF